MDLSQLVIDIKEGIENPLKGYALLLSRKKEIESYIEEIKDLATNEALKYESTFNHSGFVFHKRSGGQTYDYSDIPEWIDQKNELKKIEEKYKNAYISSQKGCLTIEGDGEVLDLPKIKYRKDSLIIFEK